MKSQDSRDAGHLSLSKRLAGLGVASAIALAMATSAHAEIDDWASAAGMSRRTFTRVFRKETGLGLSTWRQQACLLAALPRLGGGEPVTTVALDLGYDSVPAFTHMFRRMLGQPPRAYFQTANGG